MEPRAHPRNRDFAWTSPDAARTVLSEEQARQWDEAGYFLLRDAFTADEIAAVGAEIDPIQERVAAFLGTRPGGKAFIAEQGNITSPLPSSSSAAWWGLVRHAVRGWCS